MDIISFAKAKKAEEKIETHLNAENPHGITKADVGLGNADNTSDLDKPISTAVQAALDNKMDNSRVLTKVDVGLGNVDNTSDLDKPISTATQGALDDKVDNSRVLTDVPAGAVFTDTVYTHPAAHPAAMVTEDATRRFVTDTEKADWNAKLSGADIPTKVSQLENDVPYVTADELGEAGLGDMVKSIYDKNNDGIVDRADLADSVPWDGVMDKPIGVLSNLKTTVKDEIVGAINELFDKHAAHEAEHAYLQEDEPVDVNPMTLWFAIGSEVNFSEGGVVVENAEVSPTPPSEENLWFSIIE